jgi:hypothetical protein
MTYHDDEQHDALERRLLASAQSDDMPRDTSAAWTALSAKLRATAAAAGPVSGMFVRPTHETGRPRALAARRWTRRVLLLAGLVGSGLAGAGLALILVPPQIGAPHVAPPVVPAPAPSSISPSAEVREQDAPAPVRRNAKGSRGGHRHLRVPPPLLTADASAHAPGLAEEIERLDEARVASELGRHREALRLVEAYHYEFPRGALAREADVIAIDSVAAQGDRATLQQLGESFLRRYPADAHSPRVRALLAR